MQKLVFGEGGLFVAEMEVAVGDDACAASGDKRELCLIGEERGWRIGGGAGVDDGASEGAAVLVGDGACPACGLGEEWELGGDDGMAAKVGEGGAGSDDDGVGALL